MFGLTETGTTTDEELDGESDEEGDMPANSRGTVAADVDFRLE